VAAAPGADVATADRVVSLFVEFLAEVPPADRSCDELARVVDAFVEKHGGEIRAASAAVQQAGEEKRAAFRARLDEGVAGAMEDSRERLLGCQADPKVRDAFERMDQL